MALVGEWAAHPGCDDYFCRIVFREDKTFVYQECGPQGQSPLKLEGTYKKGKGRLVLTILYNIKESTSDAGGDDSDSDSDDESPAVMKGEYSVHKGTFITQAWSELMFWEKLLVIEIRDVPDILDWGGFWRKQPMCFYTNATDSCQEVTDAYKNFLTICREKKIPFPCFDVSDMVNRTVSIDDSEPEDNITDSDDSDDSEGEI